MSLAFALLPSNDAVHKYFAMYLDADMKPHKIYFGAKGYEDYTTSKDKKRKQLYIDRHKKREDWTDAMTAGFWAKHILWNKETIKESVEDIEKKHKITILNMLD